MDFVKREDQYIIDEESYKAYAQNLQKAQTEAMDYQHTPISMEQLHQAMQSTLNGSMVHNRQLTLSPRQMSTLMLKTNHIGRNLSFNELPAHLMRSIPLETDISHVTNDIPQGLQRPEDILLSTNLSHLSRNLDPNLARSLSNEIELQNTLTQNLVQSLHEQDLARSLNLDIGQNLSRISDISHLVRELPPDLNHEIDLSQHINRSHLEQSLLNEEVRRTTATSENNQILEQNLAQRLEQSLQQRLDQNVIQRVDQRLVANMAMHEQSQRQIQQNELLLTMPFQIKCEQDDDNYFYDNASQNLNNINVINGNVPVPTEHIQVNPNTQQQEQLYQVYNNHISNLPPLNPIDLYSRPQNFLQNYVTQIKENPQNLVIHRQFENESPYSQENSRKSQDDPDSNPESGESKIEEPKENLKPTNQNKTYFAEYQNAQYANSVIKDSSDSTTNNKLSENLSMNIKGEYLCYKCNQMFPSKRGLKQHAKSCIEKNESDAIEKANKFGCTQCPYKCQSPAILKIHERTHTGEKPFSCKFCDYKSGQKNNVVKHILVHMNEKPFACQYCDYRCAQKNNLVVHERTHTGYKPFACPHCDYRTVQKPNLVKHMYLHTDLKPFGCELCSYRCVQKTNLMKHMQRHVNERDGDKVDTKTGSKPYRPRQKSVKCPHCVYMCVQKSSLFKHMQFKHPELAQSLDMTSESLSQDGLNLVQNSDCDAVQNLSIKRDSVFSETQKDAESSHGQS